MDFHNVVMTNFVKRPDGNGFDRFVASDVVGDDILDAYMTDARDRWALVEDTGIVPQPAQYTVPEHLETTE